jgi:nucleotide-binding universal stress UspA family protein
MTVPSPSVLCPIDFSEPSRSALCYASAIADHFGARLTVFAVDDPFLVEAAAASGTMPPLAAVTSSELKRFCGDTLADCQAGPKKVEFRVAVGKPATEILRAAGDLHADLIVMSSQGRSGVRKMFFGSTTERVLRETSTPVLITPDVRPTTTSLSEIACQLHRVVAPVDLTSASIHQLTVAGGLAAAFSVPLIAAHVLEPIFIPYHVRMAISGADAERRAHAEERLTRIAQAVAPRVLIEPIVVTGDPSEEIVRLAEARQANLIVMGLHSSTLLGPRMGSVTYRVLCRTHAPVLALPPRAVPSSARRDEPAVQTTAA